MRRVLPDVAPQAVAGLVIAAAICACGAKKQSPASAAPAASARVAAGPDAAAEPPPEDPCGGVSPPECTAKAHAMMDGRAGEPDMPRAVTLFRAACDRGDADACFAMGRLTGEGGVEALFDVERAAKYFATACAGNVVEGCAELAILAGAGRGVGRDPKGAKRLATRACEGKSAVGCAALGVLVGADEHEGGPDLAAAYAAFERSCTIGESQAGAWSCARVAFMVDKGTGVARDPSKAKALYERACTAGLQGKNPPGGDRYAGCVATALVFDAGFGFLAEPNKPLAYALHTFACEHKSPVGCAARGGHLLRAGRKAEAQSDFKRACALGSKEACAQLK